MNELLPLIPPFAAGLVLGTIFFVGLWWTIRRSIKSTNPAMLFLSSAVLRIGIVLMGFYFISNGQWQRMAACLVGFIMSRLAVTWFTSDKPKEDRHAS